MFTAIRCFISNFIKMFSPAPQTDTEMRLQHLEHEVTRLNTMLSMHEVSITPDSVLLKQHLDTLISKSVMVWLANWADDLDFVKTNDLDDAVESCINNGSLIDDACDSWMNNQDWDYTLRDSIDWDKVAEKVAEKLDWDTIVSDNELVTNHDIDLDDVMLKSEHMSDDDLVTREDLSDMVIGELKRDWFEQKMREDVTRIFKDTLTSVRNNEEGNYSNAIDDAIVAKLDEMLGNRLNERFGPEFDIWFHNLVAHCVKSVITEMVRASYEEITNTKSEDDRNV